MSNKVSSSGSKLMVSDSYVGTACQNLGHGHLVISRWVSYSGNMDSNNVFSLSSIFLLW